MNAEKIEETKDKCSEETKSDELARIDGVPDGGFRAWLQVVGTFCIYLNTWQVLFGLSNWPSRAPN